MKNVMHERSTLEKRIKSGGVVIADLQTAAEIAKASGNLHDRVNFAKVKQTLNDKAIEVDGGEPNDNYDN